ncbi:zinc finger protein 30-like isoform X2 [Megalops cyprinoides]|nr:zinc finger protein 30-like isoform X2 [Megalops cyprinoides]
MVLSVKIERDLDPTQNMEVGANDPCDIKSEPQADTDIFNGAVVKSLTSSSPSSPVSVQIKMEAIDSACLTEKEHTDRQFCCRIEPQVPNTGSMASGHCLSSDPIKTEECDPDLRNTGQQTGSWLFCGTERQRSSTGDMSSPACRESHQVKTEPVYPPCTTTEEQMNLQGCEGAEMRTNVEKYQFTGSLISDHVKTDIDGVGVEAETAIQTFKREPCEHSENVEKFESQRVECNDCGSIFKCVTALIQHYSQIHKSETLHICILCGKSFTKASGLTWHRRTIHPPYRCTECGKSFEKNSALMKHHTIHRSKELHHCSQCGKRYTYASCLHRHLESHVE